MHVSMNLRSKWWLNTPYKYSIAIQTGLHPIYTCYIVFSCYFNISTDFEGHNWPQYGVFRFKWTNTTSKNSKHLLKRYKTTWGCLGYSLGLGQLDYTPKYTSKHSKCARKRTIGHLVHHHNMHKKVYIHMVVERGCFLIDVVAIYECRWVQWDPNEDWPPENRQGGTRMVIVGSDRTRYTQENHIKTEVRAKGDVLVTGNTGVHTGY